MKNQAGTTSDIRFVLAYGVGFITLTFLGFLSGFMVGRYFLRYDVRDSLIVSIAIGTATLIMETILMVLRIQRMEGEAARKRARKVAPGTPFNYPRSEADVLAHIRRGGVEVEEVTGQGSKDGKYDRIKVVNLDPGNVFKDKSKNIKVDDTLSEATTEKSEIDKKND